MLSTTATGKYDFNVSMLRNISDTGMKYVYVYFQMILVAMKYS
jgi:hypothetical protein